MKLLKMLLSARPTLPPVGCLWGMVSSFPGLGVNSDGISLFLRDIVSVIHLCHYMYETRSWHTYSYALGLFS